MTVDGKGEVDGASAGDCGMVDDVEIGSTRGKSRSARMFDGHVRLESTGVFDGAKRENVLQLRNAEIGKVVG
jgi:hypothetical protein